MFASAKPPPYQYADRDHRESKLPLGLETQTPESSSAIRQLKLRILEQEANSLRHDGQANQWRARPTPQNPTFSRMSRRTLHRPRPQRVGYALQHRYPVPKSRCSNLPLAARKPPGQPRRQKHHQGTKTEIRSRQLGSRRRLLQVDIWGAR